MTRWQVFYESWQFACCGEPFAVGDTVRWPLVLAVGGEGPETVEGRVEEGTAAQGVGPDPDDDFEEDGEEDEDDDDYEDDDGPPLDFVTPYGLVSLALTGAPHLDPGPDPVRLRGELLVGGHGTGGDLLPLRVHRMWVRCEPEVPDGEGGSVPDPEEPPYLREVTTSPRIFACPEALSEPPDDTGTTGGIVFLRTIGHLPGVRETGILAEVEPVPPPGA
ncbi:DUF6578 domain-containing protein [Streptomyces sp. NPDC047046]|uniref:DUF6578 domain-containing protein n=1 Tax=Streptomyces sp. NPDC047046 TaxID=3155378 RepID=UPI003402248C